ncbi:hypothetical protein K3556_08175 [Aliiroseovarius sp. M344]|uniref:DUF6477 family protein n=1 Tax=Aliiroseovarius sp. M344 TaxID=2867010 RepID=UPI0021FAB2C6|nr:DUF6477 family protein [Aliiroseovarius sp. M344]UWQ12956.1 hypothetical protein K3556_08175 [Aliiroseovarius sp. M344]
MTDAFTCFKMLRRPRILVRAARFGLVDYNRDRDLKKLMKTANTPSPENAVDGLLQEEARLEDTRKTGDASYSIAHHVEVLIALMSEMRLLPQGPREVQ